MCESPNTCAASTPAIPFDGHGNVHNCRRFDGHGGLHACPACGATWGPPVEPDPDNPAEIQRRLRESLGLLGDAIEVLLLNREDELAKPPGEVDPDIGYLADAYEQATGWTTAHETQDAAEEANRWLGVAATDIPTGEAVKTFADVATATPRRDEEWPAMRNGSWVHKLWWHCTDKSPLAWKLWRLLCWARGYHEPHHMDAYYEYCITCSKLLWSHREGGSPNPLLTVDRVPATWRKVKPQS